ncbi:unnamed protein product [Rotaria sp. Silwood2]|nr:unnamed protein product [Rotaria sp. Silwood2]CAF3333021.1 unnamed protein product [Rotaria sp. Silwood2]CAF3952831.1 unnamed protein product [Rotaria sp. Silwood2]CAF4230228.1 unnamed protein product [Rotaria sp. Silwood2]CAF4446156.1 unnamed protein product [Rotaria sp. Silwood2]
MDNEFDRYYIKIQTILGIDPKKIHEELATALGPNAPSYQTVTRLHTYTKDPLPPSAPRKTRPSTKNKIDKCLTSISPHVQKLIYTEAIDKRKGAILSGKLPLNPEQYTLMQKLGAT